jgi:hypothetical protein
MGVGCLAIARTPGMELASITDICLEALSGRPAYGKARCRSGV